MDIVKPYISTHQSFNVLIERDAVDLQLKRRISIDTNAESLQDFKKFKINSEESRDFLSVWENLFSENATDQLWTEVSKYPGKVIKESFSLPEHLNTNAFKIPKTEEKNANVSIIEHTISLEEKSKRIKKDFTTQIFKVPDKPPKRRKTDFSQNVPKAVNIPTNIGLKESKREEAKTVELQRSTGMLTTNAVSEILATEDSAITQSLNYTGMVSQFRSTVEATSRLQSIAGESPKFQSSAQEGSQSNSEEASKSNLDFKAGYQQEDISHHSVISDAKIRKRFISDRLQVLELHIQYYNREVTSIPPWSQSLSTVLNYLATRRNAKAPLSEIREEFMEILDSFGNAIRELLEDVRHNISTGNVSDAEVIIESSINFRRSIEKKYYEFCCRFYELRADYPNYCKLCIIIGNHFRICYDIGYSFIEIMIHLFETVYSKYM